MCSNVTVDSEEILHKRLQQSFVSLLSQCLSAVALGI